MALTGFVLPGVVFHILISISGDLTTTDLQQAFYVSAVVLLICVTYGACLVRQLRRHGPAVRATPKNPGTQRPSAHPRTSRSRS